jgi:hypothetical protein
MLEEHKMKEKLIRVYQLLNIINVSGQQNILALGECLNTLINIINDMNLETQEELIKIDNTKKKEE